MDTAVGLVQAYLHVNGYFTVAEYPVLETRDPGGVRTVTDLDLLALRFPGAGRERPGRLTGAVTYEPDAALQCPAAEADMLVVEVKEGRAGFNAAGRDPAVLAAALTRFGCCRGHDAHDAVRTLLLRGSARTGCGHRVRLVAFGSSSGRTGPWLTIPLEHVARFLGDYLHQHWELLRHAAFKDSALGLLALLEKAGAVVETTAPASIAATAAVAVSGRRS